MGFWGNVHKKETPFKSLTQQVSETWFFLAYIAYILTHCHHDKHAKLAIRGFCVQCTHRCTDIYDCMTLMLKKTLKRDATIS